MTANVSLNIILCVHNTYLAICLSFIITSVLILSIHFSYLLFDELLITTHVPRSMSVRISDYVYSYVTGFAKAVPDHTRTEIHLLLNIKATLLHYLEKLCTWL